MPASEPSAPAKPGVWTKTGLALLAVLVLGGLVWWLNTPPPDRSAQVVLTPEAKAYVRNLSLSDVEMQAAESYLKQAIVEINGKIGNNGDRTLKLVEINCVFYDPYGQLVLRERVPIAGGKWGPLQPGEIKSFRLPFDNIPESWNQAMPQLVIAQIQFE